MADIQSNINVNIDTTSALASIKLLQSQISAFQRDMAKTDAFQAGQSQQKLLDFVNSTGKFNASVKTIKSTTESFTTALEKNKLSLGQYFKYSVASTKSFGSMFKTEMGVVEKVARERVKSLQTQYINLGRDANGALKAISIRPLLLDLDNMQTKTAIAAQKQQILNQLLHQGSTNLLNFGKNTQWAGRQLMVGFTIPLSMAGTAAAKAYMDIEKAAIKIKRVYGDLNTSTKETNQAVDAIKNLASEYTKYGIAVADTMEMAASAAAMGKTGSELLAQVNEATRLSALGGVSQAQALETTISLTSAFGLSATELAGKINYLNAVENQTVTSIEDLTIAIPKAGPVVKQLGGDVEDLAFFLTAMREGGINASEGANALKSGLAALINPTNKASEMLAGFGINIKAIVEGNKGDLKKTVVDFATALNTIDPLNRARAIEQMFGKFQFARISTLLQNVTSSSSQASKALALADMSSIQLAAMSRKELDRISASPMYKFQKAIADLQVKIAPVGEAFLKAVTPIITFASKVLEGFNGMSEQFKNFTVVGVAVIGGLAPVLLMVVGLVANGAANILKFLTQIKSFFNRTAAGQKDLGSSTSYLTTEQIKAESVAASLDQIHGKLKQTFTSEAAAVDALTSAYGRYLLASGAPQKPTAKTGGMFVPVGKAKGYATGGIVRGPGTGTSDSIPANLSNGEAVIDAETVEKNPAIIAALFAGKRIQVPGYARGTQRVGSGSEGKKGKARGAVLRAYGDNVSNQGGLESFGSIGGMNDVASLYAPQIAKTAGVTSAAINAEVDAWKAANKQLLDAAANAVASGVPAAEAFAEVSEKFKLDMAAAEGPVHKFAETAKRIYPELEADLLEAQEYAKANNVDTRNPADLDRMRAALPNNKAVQEISTPGNFQGLMKTRSSAVAMLGTPEDYSVTGVPKTFVDSGLDTKHPLYNKSASQEHLGKTHAEVEARQSDREARATKKRSMPTTVGEDLVKDSADAMIDGQKKQAKKSAKKVKEESAAAVKTIYDASNLPSVKNALDGKKMLGPAGATQVDSYPSPKAQSGRIVEAKSPRAASPFVQDLKASAQNAMPRLRVAKQEFVDDMKGAFAQLKNLFRNGGKDMVDATKSGLIQETPRLRVAGKEAGFDYVTALKGGNGSIAAVVTSGNQKIVAAALKEYNAGGFKVAGAVSRGLDKGISSSVAKGILAGKKLADSISEGVSRSKKQKSLPMGVQGPLEQGGVRGNMLQRGKQAISEKASAAKEKISGGYNKLNSKINTTPEGMGGLAKLGAVATTAAFALSGVPGPIGQTVSTLLPFISILSAVSGLMSLFSINVVAGTVSMFGLTIPILPLIAAIAGLALVIAGVIWWMNAVNDAKAKELKSINATSKAADSAAGALNGIGKVTGVDTSQSGFTQSEGAVKGLKTGQVNDVNTLMDSQEFNHGMTARYVRDLKGVGTDRDRKDSLMGIARNMQASGSDPKVIADTIAAIQMKANAGTDRKAIVLDPKAYAVGTAEGNKALTADATAAAPKINKLGKNFYKEYNGNMDRQVRVLDVQSMVGKGRGKITQEEANKRIAAIKGEVKEFAKYSNVIKTYGTNSVMSMSAVGKSFLTGKMSLKSFRASQAAVTKGFYELDAAGQIDALAAMRESIAKSSPQTAAMAATIKDAGLQLLFLQQAAAGGGGAFTADLIAGANSGTEAGIKAFKAAAAKYNAGAQADYKKNNPEVKGDEETGGGDGSSPKDVLTGLKDAVKASALTNQLMSQNYSADFISNIAGADAATQAYYTTIKNGKVVLNEQGKALYAAYNAKTINEFLTAQKGIVAGAALELKARSQLKAAGLSAEDVKAMAARTDVQAALASANATVGAKARAAAVKKVTDALKAEVEATKSLKTAQEIFQESYDKGTAYLDNQEAKINNTFDQTKSNIDNKAAILKANQSIEDLQNGVGGATGLNQYNDGLSKLQFTEDAINKKYDERAKALGKIATINQRISEQTKGQLTLAQALASGDIAAAANAAQEMNSANANAAMEDQKTALDLAKQSELDKATVSVNGKLMTRAEIEAASKVIQEQILDIQIKQLNPAQNALSLAERARDASLSAISNQKLQWEGWKIAVDGATTSLEAYNAALAAAQPGSIPGVDTDVAAKKKTPTAAATAAYNKALAVIADKKATAAARANAQESVSFYKRVYLSSGGIVPSYFAAGGYAKGTDTVPAMLTPGEFVVRKFAVDSFGVDKLNAINSGQSVGADAGNILTAVTSNTGVSTSSSAYTDASVYNYNVNVNVRSDANPDQIAQAVMTKINQTNGQRIRGNRFNG